jgi:phosphoesterase RecJ-like protein
VSSPRSAPHDAWRAAEQVLRRLPVGAPVQLACHVNPDGDALGSMLGFGLGLCRLGHRPRASFPEPFEVPATLAALPGMDLLVPPRQAHPAPEVFVSFDAASPQRLGTLGASMAAAGCSIVLDHHASNPGFGDLPLVDPAAAATAVVALRLLDRLGVPVDAAVAECLYVGLATDTGSFSFAATTAEVHRIAARLVEAGSVTT